MARILVLEMVERWRRSAVVDGKQQTEMQGSSDEQKEQRKYESGKG